MDYDYIQNRYQDQINYYSEKSKAYQNKYHFFSVSSIVCSALVPVFTLGVDYCFIFKIIIAMLGALTTVISGVLLHFRYQELWIRYRETCNALTLAHEQYCARIGDYRDLDDENALSHFAETCEEIISNETSTWKSVYSDRSASKSSISS